MFVPSGRLVTRRVADLHHSNADPDPAVHFDADPDPDFNFDAALDPDPDPDLALHPSDAILQQLVYRPSRAPF